MIQGQGQERPPAPDGHRGRQLAGAVLAGGDWMWQRISQLHGCGMDV